MGTNPNNSLHPDSSTQPTLRLSTASSVGGIFDAYASPRASTSSSASRSLSSDPDGIGLTTATQIRRNSSPVPFSPGAGRATIREESGQLHRRSSSRVRSPDSMGAGEGAGEGAGAGARNGGGAEEDAGATAGPSETPSRRAQVGWGTYSTPTPAAPVRAPPPRSDSANSLIRPLPQRPYSIRPLPSPRPSLPPSLSGAGGNPFIDPFVASDSTSNSSYPGPSPSGSYALDDPVVAHSMYGRGQRGAASWSEDSLPTLGGNASGEEGDAENDEEEITSRSPLQPYWAPPIRTSPSTLSRSRSLQPPGAASPGGSPRSGRQSRGSSPNSSPSLGGLVRKNTLSVAAAGLRRVSVRVVNIAGAGTETLAREDDRPRSDGGHGPTGDEEGAASPILADPVGDVDLDEVIVLSDLRGRTLGIFGPENSFRKACATGLRWSFTEPLILLFILLSVIVMTIQTSPNVYTHPRPTKGYFHAWEDYALFVAFVAFTAEILARIVVTGLIINPPPPPTPRNTMADRLSKSPSAGAYPPPPRHDLEGFQTLRHFDSTTSLVEHHRGTNPSDSSSSLGPEPTFPLPRTGTLKTLAGHANTPFVLSIRRQRTTYQHAFLRHSWNRLDFVAVTSFWISFVLALLGLESEYSIYIFRALSVLRATRLLAVTTGTTTILNSLKGAAPQLIKVALLVAFAMVMFSIIGVQSFNGSYKRSCEWIDPTGLYQNVTLSQMCGGFINATTGSPVGYIDSTTGLPSGEGSKGFICPAPSICIESSNPDNGSMNFDNIFAALLQVVIVASANTWSNVMYDMMYADFFVSCLYFIACVLVLNYWLINMFVAVITNTFGSIMDETKHSAFASKTAAPVVDADKGAVSSRDRMNQAPTFVRKAYEATRLVWVLAVVADIGFQASRNFSMTPAKLTTLSRVELHFTLAFDVEILIRAIASLPDWRTLSQGENAADVSLAVLTTLIQIPAIHNSPAYPWLTVFQLGRFYRVILAVPRMRPLLVRVLGTFTGLVNMVLFMLMMTFLAALMAAQLVRGSIPYNASGDAMDYYQIFNSFLAMYQILSSENWTTPLDSVLTNQLGVVQVAIAATFLSAWMLFSYFIMINMFIAVINENFAVAEEEKHKQQLEAYVKRNEPETTRHSFLQRFNPYNHFGSRAQAPEASSPETTSSPVEHPMSPRDPDETEPYASTSSPVVSPLIRVFRPPRRTDTLDSFAAADVPSPTEDGYAGQLLPIVRSTTRDPFDLANDERRAREDEFISAHPSYDRSLWIFSQANPIRRFCQRLFEPAYGGERIRGRKAVRREKLAFEMLLLVAIVGSIAVAGVASPLYRRNYFCQNGDVRWTWFNLTEISLGLLFILEFFIKVVADGFVFGPNAYLLSIWNGLDFFVLITLIVNIVTAFIAPSGISRFTRALKAFRALRLIGLRFQIRDTFYNVLIVGAGRILDASVLAILYIIPFAIWGINVFSGVLYFCNDSSVTTKAECAGEYLQTALVISGANSQVTDNWSFMAPRIWTNPYVWTFDTFRGSLLILFEIISLEGWVNVMESVMQIKGKDLQPQLDASQFNALFFVLYNLVGAVFILTLFVSVIIENFTRRSGTLLLTTEQRQWADLRKLILRQRPAKRPRVVPTTRFRRWCFDRANAKRGWWARSMTVLYCLHVIVLMTQAATNASDADTIRNYIFLVFTVVLLVDIFVRLVGLGWNAFVANGWNLFDVFAVSGAFATTIPILLGVTNESAIQLQKLFLVSISFKLVQKNDALNELFKTAAASLPAILSIFSLWLVLFLVWAIFYLEVFGLTRWRTYGTPYQNYSHFWYAMVMLAIQSTGEGWNGFMHDYTVEYPQCTANDNYLLSDCGRAFALFITWNVLSMYLMSNLILGAVVENFSYVFQNYGKVKSLNREQMRNFKKVWRQFDPERTGYIQKKDIVPFFAKLSGIFEVKIFRTEWRLPALWAATVVGPDDGSPATFWVSKKRFRAGRSVDLTKLRISVNDIDFEEVKQRKNVYNYLYHEAMIDVEANLKGISFQGMLHLLAHYCLIQDDKALQPEEAVVRKAKMRKVLRRVEADKVRSLLKTIVHRRKFLETQAAARREAAGAPAIMVEGTEGLHIDISKSTPPGSLSNSPSSPTFGTRANLPQAGSDDPRFSLGSGAVYQRQSTSAEPVENWQKFDQ